MAMSPLVFICLCLATLASASDKPIPRFPSTEHAPSFHARSTVRVAPKNSQILSDDKMQYIEEYHDVPKKRGRFDTDTGKRTFTTFYDDTIMQAMRIEDSESERNCLVSNIDADYLAKQGKWAFVDVDTMHGRPLLMGPSSIWKKIVGVLAPKNTEAYYEQTDSIRGIVCDRWRVPFKDANSDVEIIIHFMNPHWEKFEKIDIEIPVRFVVRGKKNLASGTPEEFALQVDYYLFEPYPETWREFIPKAGLGCDGRKTPEDMAFPGKKNKDGKSAIPDEFAVTTVSKMASEVSIFKSDLYMSGPGKVARFDIFDQGRGTVSVVSDLDRSVSYTFTPDGKCTIAHLYSPMLQKQRIDAKVLRTVQEFLHMDGDYYYLGVAYRRGVLCEVWERVITDKVEIADLSYQNSGQFPSAIDKVVITHYFNTATDDSDPKTVLVQGTLNGYRARRSTSRNRPKFENVFSQTVDYFNFRPLYFGKTFLDAFDVKDCYFQDTDKKYFELFVSTDDGDLQKKLSKHVNHLRQQAVFAIGQAASISPLRIPAVEVEFVDKGFVLNVLILEKLPPTMSFLQQTSDGTAVVTDKDNGPYKVEDLDQCATMALQNEYGTGFLFCNGGCFVMTRIFGGPDNGEPVRGSDKMQCDMFYRDDRDSSGSKLAAEPDLKTVEKKLNGLVTDKLLVIKLSKEVVDEKLIPDATFTISNMAAVPSPIQRANDKMRFELSLAQNKIRKGVETSVAIDGSAFGSLGDCYLACRDEESMQCQSFSFCRTNNKVECVLSSVLLNGNTSEDERKSNVVEDTQCSVFIRSYLSRFDKLDGKVSKLTDGTEVDKDAPTTALDCARLCTYHKDFDCESFEYCSSGQCVLRKEHYLDISDASSKMTDSDTCDFYSVKYISEMTMTGSDLAIDDNPISSLTEVTADDCAARCAKDSRCASINFCPRSATSASNCMLTTKSVLDIGTETDSNPLCRNYDKPASSSKSVQKSPGSTPSTRSGLTGGGFFGLVFAMFFVGAAFGAAAYLGWNRFHSRGTSVGGGASGFTSSVTFRKHKDEENAEL